MKISFLAQDLFRQGAQAATAMLIRGFCDKGYEVDLLLSKVHLDYRSAGESGEFTVPSKTRYIFLKSRKARKNIFELRKYLMETDSEAVVAMAPPYAKALRIAAIGLKKTPRLIYVEHGLSSRNDKGEIIHRRHKFSVFALLDWLFWRRFNRILVVSSAAIEDFRGIHPYCPKAQFHVVHNPVISDDFLGRLNRGAQHPWLTNKTCKTFVSAGAYVANKGHMTILNAFAKLKRRGVNARIIIFGQGGMESQYRDFISRNALENVVSIPGFSDNVPAEERASDGYILSSRTESFGIALVEAMAAGCPIVATDAPFGPREILRDGRYGELVPVDDSDSMAAAIERLCCTEKISPPRESWESYTIEATVRKYELGIGLLNG